MNGARDYLRALRLKILRDRLAPERVAAGWSIGMFIGCFVPFGLQLIISVPLAVATRTSKIGATVGTLITNPFTILFIYPFQTWAGSYLICSPLSWAAIKADCARLAEVSLFSSSGWQSLGQIGAHVLVSFFVGGLAMGLVLTPITYLIVYRMVKRHRVRQDARRRASRQKRSSIVREEVS